jgi:hypothetical protein
MRDPRTHAWLYLAFGVLAIVGACCFLYVDYSVTNGGFAIFDWALLGMGAWGVYRGVKSLRELGPRPPEDGPEAK